MSHFGRTFAIFPDEEQKKQIDDDINSFAIYFNFILNLKNMGYQLRLYEECSDSIELLKLIAKNLWFNIYDKEPYNDIKIFINNIDKIKEFQHKKFRKLIAIARDEKIFNFSIKELSLFIIDRWYLKKLDISELKNILNNYCYNIGLPLNEEYFDRKENIIKFKKTGNWSKYLLVKWLTEEDKKNNFSNLSAKARNEIPNIVEKAMKNFFNNGFGRPKFKRVKNCGSFTQSVQQGKGEIVISSSLIEKGKDITPIQLNSTNWVRIPKYSPIKIFIHQDFIGNIKYVTISKNSIGKYFISFNIENEVKQVEKRVVTEESTRGYDLGISSNNLIVSDEGEEWDNVDDKKLIKQIKYYDRKLSKIRERNKNYKNSRRYKQIKERRAKLHLTLKNKRSDNTHKATHKIASREDTSLIGIEDLNVKGMVKNHNLAGRIHHSNLFEIKRQLQYKSEINGITLQKVSRWYASTQTCSNCGMRLKKKGRLSLEERVAKCEHCGYTDCRDKNAARNIKGESYKEYLESRSKG